jgi:uncharacterized membrane protein YcaP (DUF421 family)
MREASSLISAIIRLLMFLETKMLKDKKFMHGRDTVVLIRDGELSMKVRATSKRLLKDLIENMDFTL